MTAVEVQATPSDYATIGWAIFALLLTTSLVWLLWDVFADRTREYLQRWGSRGLIRFVGQIRAELLGVGVLALVLVAAQELVASQCVYPVGESPPASSAPPVAASSWGRRLQQTSSIGLWSWSCADVSNAGLGFAISRTTYLLSLVAAVHVLLSISIGLLTLAKVRRWKRWEELGEEGVVTPMHSSIIKVMHPNEVLNDLNIFLVTLFRPLRRDRLEPIYLGIRHMFMERMPYLHREWSDDFPFVDFLFSTAAIDLSELVHVNWMTPGTAAFYLLVVKTRISVMDWVLISTLSTAIFMLLVAAAKTTIVAIKLGGISNSMFLGSKDTAGALLPSKGSGERSLGEEQVTRLVLPPAWQRSDSNSAASVVAQLVSERMGDVKPYVQEPARLFWFKRPGLLLRIYQFAYFQVAFALAVAAFYYPQFSKVDGAQSGGPFWAAMTLLVVGPLSLWWAAWYFLPLFSLTRVIEKLALNDARMFATEVEEHSKLEELRRSNKRRIRDTDSEDVGVRITSNILSPRSNQPPANQWQVRSVTYSDGRPPFLPG